MPSRTPIVDFRAQYPSTSLDSPLPSGRQLRNLIRQQIRANMRGDNYGREQRPPCDTYATTGAIIGRAIAARRRGTMTPEIANEIANLWRNVPLNWGASEAIQRALPACPCCHAPHAGSAPVCTDCTETAARDEGQYIVEIEGVTRRASARAIDVLRTLQRLRGLPDITRHSDQIFRAGVDLGQIRNYSSRTGRLSTDPGRDPVQHGIELETAYASRALQAQACRAIHSTYPPSDCQVKHDGSILGHVTDRDRATYGPIDGEGEIVTGYGDWVAVLDVLRGAMARAREAGAICPSSCGVHISASRANLSESAIARIIAFWSNPSNETGLDLFARRKPNQFAVIPPVIGLCPMKEADRIYRSVQGNRYSIVSTAHDTHIEFRGFAGSMTYALNRARLALVVELVEYCRTGAGATLADLTWGPFSNWMKQRRTLTAKWALKRLAHRGPGRERPSNLRARTIAEIAQAGALVYTAEDVRIARRAHYQIAPGRATFLPAIRDLRRYLQVYLQDDTSPEKLDLVRRIDLALGTASNRGRALEIATQPGATPEDLARALAIVNEPPAPVTA
jgi:hypothetical protein